MAIEVTPLHPTLGAELRGVDLTCPLAPAVFAEIEAAFNRRGILVFPEQPLTDEQQLAFSRLFGPLEVNPNYAGAKMRLRADIADISNLDAGGRVLARDDPRNLFNLGNQLWHTDSSFKHIPAKCSLLSARELPTSGGETEFADLRAAWDALPEAKKRELDGLVVEHSIFRSRSRSALPTSTTRSSSNCHRWRRRWCATTATRAAPASISPRTPRISSAGRSRREER